MNIKTKKLVYSGVFLALCLLLPFLTMQIPQIGSAISPMHIPVLICGFVCGLPYAPIIGFIAPLLRYLLFGMPPIFPVGIAMAFELMSYGLFTAVFSKILPKNTAGLYASLVIAMLLGRIVWGTAMFLIMLSSGKVFTFNAFLTGAFIGAIPGIICHLILVPIVVLALNRSGASA